MLAEEPSALWRRVDIPGHEAVRVYEGEDGWYIDGSAIFLHEVKPCRLEYLIECDADWQTRSVTVDGFVGDEIVAIEIDVDGDVWFLNGEEIAAVEGCIDIDLNFSPATNLLPIKRSQLAVGDEVSVRAAWLRFPSFELELLEQTYARTNESTYNYRSATGFEASITVDENGLVVDYPNVWAREE